MHTISKYVELPKVQNFRFILALATFIVYIAIPMTFEYSSDNSKYAGEYSEFLGLDIFGIVSMVFLGLSGELNKTFLFAGALGLLIYVLTITHQAKNDSSQRALQAKMGFFTDGIIVALSGYIVMNGLTKYLKLNNKPVKIF